jgi:hypothetical protein
MAVGCQPTGRAGDQKLLPTYAMHPVTARHALASRRRNHQGREFWISTTEFQQPFQGVNIEVASFNFDSPVALVAFKHSIDFKRFFSPIGDHLSLIHRKGQARIFNPGAETRRFF